MKKNIETYIEYCTGCGLCHSTEGVKFSKDEKGFEKPQLNEKNYDFLSRVCPSSGEALKHMDTSQVWGGYRNIYLGWSNNDDMRRQASSGGIITAIAVYLLEKGLVNAIIQTGSSTKKPWETETFCSRSKEEVLSHCGSRYAMSSPLMDIINIVQPGEKYAFIGKPCDCTALKNYFMINPKLSESIIYVLSFFCAGVPSENANKKLISELGCDITKINSLNYRGNGWPGYATAIDIQGSSYQMTYDESWGKILGRDIRRMCRFCIDGIGEMADISCGDAWHLTEDNKPDFSESDGRNVIFARTNKGDILLNKMYVDGYISILDFKNDVENLNYMQKFQMERKATMLSKVVTLSIFNRNKPQYKYKMLLGYAKKIPLKKQFEFVKGTAKRIFNRKIQ